MCDRPWFEQSRSSLPERTFAARRPGTTCRRWSNRRCVLKDVWSRPAAKSCPAGRTYCRSSLPQRTSDARRSGTTCPRWSNRRCQRNDVWSRPAAKSCPAGRTYCRSFLPDRTCRRKATRSDLSALVKQKVSAEQRLVAASREILPGRQDL